MKLGTHIMTKYLAITGILAILILAVILAGKCQKGDDPRIAQLQADTARQGKIIRSLQYKADSTYNQAIKAEEANIKPKKERKELKNELPKSKTLKDSANTLLKLDKNADEIIGRQDTVIDDLKKVKLFQDSTINHLEAKVKDVGEMNEIHLRELKREERRSFWHRVKDIALPILALLVGMVIAK